MTKALKPGSSTQKGQVMNNPAERFFNRPYILDERITRTVAEIERLTYLMLPSGIDYSRPQVMSTPEDIMTKYAAEKADLEDELARLQREYLRARDDIKAVLEALDEVDSRGATILCDIYISHKSVQRIAQDRHYNRQHLYKIRDKALQQAWRLYKDLNNKGG